MIPYTSHQLRAAVRVARIMDRAEDISEDTLRSFPLVLSQREHRSRDLQTGLAILIEAGLVERDGHRIVPSAALFVLANLAEADALRYLERVFESHASELARNRSGAAGEAAVVEAVVLSLSCWAAEIWQQKSGSLVCSTTLWDMTSPRPC